MNPAASSSERISFNRINKKSGNRLKQQLVDGETGKTVEKEDIGRGYEIGKGQYLQVEDEEIEKIRIESSHTIAIDTFVPRSEIDDRYIDAPYYIAPTDQVGQEAFSVIRDAIREKGMVALGRVVISRREHVMMLTCWRRRGRAMSESGISKKSPVKSRCLKTSSRGCGTPKPPRRGSCCLAFTDRVGRSRQRSWPTRPP
jgi:Ku protein